jgi:hypothetical protein
MEFNLRRILTSAALAALATLGAGSAHAYTTFFGEDLNNSGATPLTTLTNSAGAQTTFLSNLTGAGVEDFESYSNGTTVPLTINFAGFGGSNLTATLGGSGAVGSVTPGTTNGVGRYSIPSASSSKYWETDPGAGSVGITFGQKIAAFGFYGIDIGDFGGQLTVDLLDGATIIQTLTVNSTIGSNGSTDGSVVYFGLIAENAGQQFNSIRFNTTNTSGDFFAFDNFTIAEQRQVTPIPEPASLALVAVALLGLGLSQRRRG